MTSNYLLGFFAALALILIFWAVKGFALTPVRNCNGIEVSIKIRVSGSEPELEKTLRGLRWLRDNNSLRADVIVDLTGADESSRQIARSFAKYSTYISLYENGEGYDGAC